jgi:hypothetical protein
MTVEMGILISIVESAVDRLPSVYVPNGSKPCLPYAILRQKDKSDNSETGISAKLIFGFGHLVVVAFYLLFVIVNTHGWRQRSNQYRIVVQKRPWVLYPFETPRSNITLHTHTSSPDLFITQVTLFFVSADIENSRRLYSCRLWFILFLFFLTIIILISSDLLSALTTRLETTRCCRSSPFYCYLTPYPYLLKLR